MASKFSITGVPVYPHIKLTQEAFPRALATRILKDDGDEYFGAFLSRTSVRIHIDLLNRTFRLRSCTIAIDGTFPVPCTQYYAKRCVAPCVSSLCDSRRYSEIVDLVRLFLRNDRELFRAAITKKIERTAADLDFEAAGFFRDIHQSAERSWSNARWQVWLDDCVDTFELQEDNRGGSVILITQRRRRALGEIVFNFPPSRDIPATQALADVITQFYQFHLPREIRVSHDFDGRTRLAKRLGSRFGKAIKIIVATNSVRRITTDRALDRTKERLSLQALASKPNADQIKRDLVRVFQLNAKPSRIEAFDAAHISATGFAGGVAVWKDGKDLPDEYEHWLSDRDSELETLRVFIADRISRTKPDLIVIDGGRSQLKAGVDAVREMTGPPRVIAAVKPKGKHTSISHFLTNDGRRVEFDSHAAAFQLLQRLRDEAHDLANATHRLGRDMMYFYELAAIFPSLNERQRQELMREVGSISGTIDLDEEFFLKRFGKTNAKIILRDLAAFRDGDVRYQPLIVPIRYVETGGAAEDLIPIETRQ